MCLKDYRNLKQTLSLAMFFSIRILFASLHTYVYTTQPKNANYFLSVGLKGIISSLPRSRQTQT